MFSEVSRFQIINILTLINFYLSSLRIGGFSFSKVFGIDLLRLALETLIVTQLTKEFGQLWCVDFGWMPDAHQTALSLPLLSWTWKRRLDGKQHVG